MYVLKNFNIPKQDLPSSAKLYPSWHKQVGPNGVFTQICPHCAEEQGSFGYKIKSMELQLHTIKWFNVTLVFTIRTDFEIRYI